MLMYKIKRTFEFLFLLRVEPYLFLFIFFYSVKRVPLDQLIQDKICFQKYNLTHDYCLELPHMSSESDYLNKKSLILGDVTQFSIYSSLITTIPTLIAALFIGSWTDKYIKAKKYLLIAGAISGVCEALILVWSSVYFDSPAYYVLLSYVPSAFSGGMIGSLTAIWSYISTTTPPKLRAMRMTIAELVTFAATPSATYIGGQLLNEVELFKNGHLRNYTMVFIIGGIFYFVALLWAIFMINESKDIIKFNLKFNKNSNLEMKNMNKNEGQKSTENTINHSLDHKNKYQNKHPLKLLFNWNNVMEMFRTCLKRRDNYVRLQIWLLFLSMLCYLVSHIGPMMFLYQFAQKVYLWNSKEYSNASALGYVVNALATFFIASILIKIIKVKDTVLALIGVVSYFGQNMIRALMLTETGFYISIAVGGLGSVTSVGIRSHFSKIVEHKELGKVFSLMSAIDSVAPLIASSLFTIIFRATMDTMPGLSFIVTGGLLLIPFTIMMWIDIYTVIPNFDNKKADNEEKKEENNEVFTVKLS